MILSIALWHTGQNIGPTLDFILQSGYGLNTPLERYPPPS